MFKLFSLLFVVSLLLSFGCDQGNDDSFVPASDTFVCTVAFVTSSLTLADATEGVAYADTTTLVTSTTGGFAPFTYSGTFSSGSNLLIESDGDIVSGTGGAGTPGSYSATVTVTDATGVCTDTVLVGIDILPSGPTSPRIDSVDHTNTGSAGGTDTVLGTALSGLDTVPDFLGVEATSASSRDFVIFVDSDGDGLDVTTVNTTNVSIFEIDATLGGGGSFLSTASYTVTYAPLPADTITVSIPSTTLLDGGRTYVITVSPAVMSNSGLAFTIAPTAINSVVFLTTPDFTTLVFAGLSSGGASCTICHDGSIAGGMAGGIAITNGGTVTLDFTGTSGTAFTSLLVADSGDPTRTYLSMNNGVSGFPTNNPNSAILANKISATTAFGATMPLGSATLDGSSATLTGGPTDPDTGTTITAGKFVIQVRSWIRGGAPNPP